MYDETRRGPPLALHQSITSLDQRGLQDIYVKGGRDAKSSELVPISDHVEDRGGSARS
jgi:hypothetical protein